MFAMAVIVTYAPQDNDVQQTHDTGFVPLRCIPGRNNLHCSNRPMRRDRVVRWSHRCVTNHVTWRTIILCRLQQKTTSQCWMPVPQMHPLDTQYYLIAKSHYWFATSQHCCDKTIDHQMALYREWCFPNCTKSW